MTTKAERAELQILKDKHFDKYGAPLGYRKCAYNISDKCLDVAESSLFRFSQCKECRGRAQRISYDRRVAKAGLPVKKRGRPVGTVKKASKAKDSDDE